jgi:hypothetical protein
MSAWVKAGSSLYPDLLCPNQPWSDRSVSKLARSNAQHAEDLTLRLLIGVAAGPVERRMIALKEISDFLFTIRYRFVG